MDNRRACLFICFIKTCTELCSKGSFLPSELLLLIGTDSFLFLISSPRFSAIAHAASFPEGSMSAWSKSYRDKLSSGSKSAEVPLRLPAARETLHLNERRSILFCSAKLIATKQVMILVRLAISCRKCSFLDFKMRLVLGLKTTHDLAETLGATFLNKTTIIYAHGGKILMTG